MKFFFADNLDYVDPKYDFLTEDFRPNRRPQIDDHYAHESLNEPPYDGLLVSRNVVGGAPYTGRYTKGQRYRFLRQGAAKFLRYPPSDRANKLDYPIIGDCGSFSYIQADLPSISNHELIDYYIQAGFNYGVSIDHINLQQNDSWDDSRLCPIKVGQRTEFSFHSAVEFWQLCQQKKVGFEPIGVVQSWSPRSAAGYAAKLVETGYRYIGLGGLSSHTTSRIYDVVAEVRAKIPDDIRLHLFGFNRLAQLDDFHGLNITSFDSTSPLIRSFKDETNNYFAWPDSFKAIRIPSTLEAGLKRKIQAGTLKLEQIQDVEQAALAAIRAYANRQIDLDSTLEKISQYNQLVFPGLNHRDLYAQTLSQRPWENCGCQICQQIGVEVVIFRGFNRNKRRGFHNLHFFYQQLKKVRDQMTHISAPCIKIEQSPGKYLYSFVIEGKKLAQFATVSRIKRDEQQQLLGYQRMEVSDHVADIKSYLEREDSILPNSLVIAFQQQLEFESVQQLKDGELGIIKIEIGAEEKPGWIVDGQQRAAALRLMKRDNFPVSVIGFHSTGTAEEREQFMLVNNSKPLPKSLVYELLPTIENEVPPKLRKRRQAYILLERLNLDDNSPFYFRIKTATYAHLEQANIKDMSILKMIENGISDGILSQFKRRERRISVLKNYWSAVSQIYPQAWLLPPQKSRLTHGVGIVSMGYLMDAIAYRISRENSVPSQQDFEIELRRLDPIPWTAGSWQFGPEMIIPWNGLQNIGPHVDMVTNYLIRNYRQKIAA